VLAPVAMIGGWTLAAGLEPGFDAVRGTISELATGAVRHPGVMTAGLLVTGAAHVGTALALRGAPRSGRAVLALGGVATAAVGLLPVDRVPGAHAAAAAVAFGALALWPAAAARRRGPAPLRPVVVGTSSAVLLGLLAWFVAALTSDGATTGLAERVVAGAQSLAPLALVLALRRASPTTGADQPGRRDRPA
jgi:hypothetical membrane protein